MSLEVPKKVKVGNLAYIQDAKANRNIFHSLLKNSKINNK